MEDLNIKTVNVSDKGQIALPIEMRQKMNILRGDRLLVMQLKDKILIEKVKNADRLKDEFIDILKFNELSLDGVWNNKEDDIWGSYLK